ncbi:glycoside hydrolase family 3 N-terminal domain-containing protein [Runella sp.]|jgi:beta-N-acetylhexosaminidase|uniref:glycoside hydrolase family 3 N-terminal domain-containing protein n=1 Tax=Runella sp. TaxID=1960881 RepID=UPI002638AD0D|nr:glycoside hydrolase family 3 N-terminal domain-containing protein [Runella sp.]
MKRLFLLLFSTFCTLSLTFAQQITPPFLQHPNQRWIDSVFNSLSPDERIAQLIMVAAHGYPTNPKRVIIDTTFSNPRVVAQYIRDYKVGGVIFFQGGPVQQAQLTNYYQSISKVPLLVAMDSEWGLAMRLDSAVRFPYQMTMGAIQGNDDLIYRMGRALAAQKKRLGVHINFAPSVDVNNNANNPVINFRSFGENPQKVFEKSYAYMKGMQDGGILSSLKHFPGHGDTGVDSHFELPVIPHKRARLDSVELYPFRKLIEKGADGIMMAHLAIPILDTAKNVPSTLSKPIVTGLLRDQLHFNGLIYSDAMNMNGLVKYFPNGTGDAKGLEAGMDILEFSPNVPAAIAEIKKSIAEGRISQAEIDARVKKVLAAKAWVGLDKFKPIETKNLIADINDKESELLNRLLTENALTVLKNEGYILPIKHLEKVTIASISLTDAPAATTATKEGVVALGMRNETTNTSNLTVFQKTLSLYTNVDHFVVHPKTPDSVQNVIRAALKSYDVVLVGAHLNNIRPGTNYGITPTTAAWVKELANNGNAVITVFGNAYSLNKLEDVSKAKALVMAYQLTPFTEELSAQLLFGAIPAKGKLPVTVNTQFGYGAGLDIPAIGRLKYTIPEEVGLDSKWLSFKIDSIANNAIAQKATPSIVVQLAKDGKVFYRKAYGTHVFATPLTMVNVPPRPAQLTDLYDFASVTKIAGSTMALARLHSEGKFNLDGTMKDYLPDFKNSNKADLVWRQVLTHQAGLRAFIPFWQNAKNADGTWKKGTFVWGKEAHGPYTVQITDSLWLHKKYHKKIFKAIKDSPLNARSAVAEKNYVYSDLSFMLYPQVVKNITGVPFEDYLKTNVYRKIGANSLTFNPLRFNDLSTIVPTERDTFYRQALAHGRVHDEGAGMLGGLSGHAGLFGNANDLMKVTQLYLQKGSFGGESFISENTMNEFTSYQFPESRRGIGFDKPCRGRDCGNAPKSATAMSYGHTGYTGIMIWNDPAYNFNYVFLSNRVYPTRDNNKISTLNVRTAIMQVVYEGLGVK